MRRVGAVVGVALVLATFGPAGAAGALETPCQTLEDVAPVLTQVLTTGRSEEAKATGRALRKLASAAELVPREFRGSFRKIARFLERAPRLTMLERVQALGRLGPAFTDVIEVSINACSGLDLTTTTSRPLR